MKRVVAIVILMAVVTSLFAFSVSAATPTYVNRYTDGVTISNTTWYIDAMRLNTSSMGTSALGGGMETIIYITAYVSNDNDSAALISLPKFTLDISDNRLVSHLYSYGGEFTLSQNSLGFYLVPNEEFTYANNNGSVVVPPNRTLYFIGAVGISATSNGQSTDAVTLNGVHLYDKANYSVTLGDYSYGDSVDLSEVIAAIDDLIDTVSTHDQLEDLIDAVSFNGTGYLYTAPTYINNVYSYTYPDANSPLATMSLRRFVGRPYLISIDVDNNSTNDASYVNGAKRYPFYIKIATNISNNSKLAFESIISNLFPTNTVVNIDYFYSECYSGLYRDNQDVYLRFNHKIGNYTYLNSGWYNTYLVGHIDVQYNSELTFPSVNLSNGIRTISLNSDNVYLPVDEYTILRDLYLSLVEKSSDDNTEEAAEMNDEIHEQEQVWYDNNSDALEAVGLSNYRFSQSQSSGIYTAVTQFQAVWNALGNWTNIYIFILILSISTYIIRHEPTTRVKQYRSSVQAERAERISYYGRKNAESRASSSGSTLKNAIRRRK